MAPIPHLWFASDAVEAARFYCDVFPDSHVDHVGVIPETPSGDCDVVEFTVAGRRMMAISAGDVFTPTPALSFILNFDPSQMDDAVAELDRVWDRLIAEGQALMPLQEYPFSKRFGWVQDKWGFSWQLMLTDPEGDPRPFLTPALMFANEKYGQAGKAIDAYVDILGGERGVTVPNEDGTIMFADFQLRGEWFAAMDSPGEHAFTFNEAVSLLVECADQVEIDRLWDALSKVPEAEQCGWCKDEWGVSWQVVPASMQSGMRDADETTMRRLVQAMLPMKKLDAATLEAATMAKSD